MNTPIVSIIVPCYKQAQYLNECLQSVYKQTFKNWECIIVNDGSPDNTEEISKLWVEKDKRFQYFYKQNGGLSSARNFGVNLARGEFILPLDADDKISNNYVQLCLQKISSSDKIKVVYGKAFKFGLINEEWKLASYNFKNLLFYNQIYCSAIYRKIDWERVNGYDEKMNFGFEDWEFWINILKDGGIATKIDKIVFFYRTKEESMTTRLNDNKKMIMQNYIFEKHKNLYGNKTELELYIKNFNTENKLNNLYKFLSYKNYLSLGIQKVKYSFSKILKNWI